MKKEDREKVIAAFMTRRHPRLSGRLSIDFRRTRPPGPEGSRKLFRARKSPVGVSVELRCHPAEDAFKPILRRAADAAKEILDGVTHATAIGERERVA